MEDNYNNKNRNTNYILLLVIGIILFLGKSFSTKKSSSIETQNPTTINNEEEKNYDYKLYYMVIDDSEITSMIGYNDVIYTVTEKNVNGIKDEKDYVVGECYKKIFNNEIDLTDGSYEEGFCEIGKSSFKQSDTVDIKQYNLDKIKIMVILKKDGKIFRSVISSDSEHRNRDLLEGYIVKEIKNYSIKKAKCKNNHDSKCYVEKIEVLLDNGETKSFTLDS